MLLTGPLRFSEMKHTITQSYGDSAHRKDHSSIGAGVYSL